MNRHGDMNWAGFAAQGKIFLGDIPSTNGILSGDNADVQFASGSGFAAGQDRQKGNREEGRFCN